MRRGLDRYPGTSRYKRVRALARLGADLVQATEWTLSEKVLPNFESA